MMESFQLGVRDLQEIWGLVLPPSTLLELRKLARLPSEQFRMPDELWVRIVYDFALAHRLRTINRDHLLKSMTPLYLAWVSSYAHDLDTAEGQHWKRGSNVYPSHTNPAKLTLCPDGVGRTDSTLSSLGAVTEVFMWSQIKQQLAESTARFLTRFASLLPGLAALIVALLISMVVGWILAAVVRRLLSSMQFDTRLARWGFPSVAARSPMKRPT